MGVIRRGRRRRLRGLKGEKTGTQQVNLHTRDGIEALVEGRVGTSTRNWLTDVKKKKKRRRGRKRKSLMTPTLLPPSREEPDGTKAPHCCPLTQDHQGPGRERGTGGWKEDGAGMGGGKYSVCVCVCVCVCV